MRESPAQAMPLLSVMVVPFADKLLRVNANVAPYDLLGVILTKTLQIYILSLKFPNNLPCLTGTSCKRTYYS